MDQCSERPNSRSASKAWTRERVLDSARQVFAERGFEGASITEIAKSANVAVGSVYGHFATKRELFWAVLNERLAQESAAASVAMQGDLNDFIERYNQMLVESSNSTDRVALQAEIWLYAIRDETFRGEMAEHQRRVGQMVSTLVGQLRKGSGKRFLLSDEEVTVVATALFRSLSQIRRVDPDGVPDDLFGKCMLPLLTLEARH